MKAKIAYLKIDSPKPECNFTFLKELYHIVSFNDEKEIVNSLEDGERLIRSGKKEDCVWLCYNVWR